MTLWVPSLSTRRPNALHPRPTKETSKPPTPPMFRFSMIDPVLISTEAQRLADTDQEENQMYGSVAMFLSGTKQPTLEDVGGIIH